MVDEFTLFFSGAVSLKLVGWLPNEPRVLVSGARLFRECRCYRNNLTLSLLRGQSPGHLSDVVPPLPIPNREVKRISGDDSIRATVCENSSWPGLCPFLWLGVTALMRPGVRRDFGG